MRRLVEQLRAIAPAAGVLLLRGEAGVGKRLWARAAHVLARRSGEPFITLDCTALAADVLELALFGATGASARGGALAAAAGGTLVITEIAALPMPAQSRLLHALEERAYRGESGTCLPVRCAVIALSSVDLERAVARRTFRQDLYFRLAPGSFGVPALRSRAGEIVPLARSFVARAAELHRRPELQLSAAARAALAAYDFPGNVAELRMAVELATLKASPPEIQPEDLPAHLHRAPTSLHMPSLAEVERAYIAEVLACTDGRKTEAAAILGISRKTLLEKRKRYGIE